LLFSFAFLHAESSYYKPGVVAADVVDIFISSAKIFLAEFNKNLFMRLIS